MKINMIDYKNQVLELTDIENAKLATHMVSIIEAESAARRAWAEDADNYLPRLVKGDAVDILNYVDDKDIPEYRKRNLDKLRKMADAFNENIEYYTGYKHINSAYNGLNVSGIKAVAHYDALINDNIMSAFIINNGEMNRLDFKTCDGKIFIPYQYADEGVTINRSTICGGPHDITGGIGNTFSQVIYCTLLADKPIVGKEIRFNMIPAIEVA